MGLTTGYKLSDGTDIGIPLVERSYLIDRYPELVNTFKQAGLWAWGANATFGQLGNNSTGPRSSPVQTIAAGTTWKQVSCGNVHTAAIKTDGTLWTWGRASVYGQLGNASTTNRSSPVQTIAMGTNWKQVSCGAMFTAAIKTDGTLWLWGNNGNGQLGNNSFSSVSSPIQTISGGINWKQVSARTNHTAAIKTDGTLWSWGYNGYGQLGTNNITAYASPIQTIAAGTNWKQVACSEQHTAAIKTDGTLWTWGRNYWGTLGDNTANSKSSPIQTIAGGTNWKEITCGDQYNAAIKTDGTLWLWGRNNYGQLGNNTNTVRSSPVQTIAAGTNWKQVSSGYAHTAAIKTNGTLWTWGANYSGQLADNTTTRKSSPVQTISGGTTWKQVACGSQFTLAIRDDSSDIFGNSI